MVLKAGVGACRVLESHPQGPAGLFWLKTGREGILKGNSPSGSEFCYKVKLGATSTEWSIAQQANSDRETTQMQALVVEMDGTT